MKDRRIEFIDNKAKGNKEGSLFIDRVLFESYYPILFSCVNQSGDYYICVCCQNNGNRSKWLIGKTFPSLIVKALKNEISIRDLLVSNTSSKITVDKVNDDSNVSYDNQDWNESSIYLPKEDSYLDPDDGEYDEDIRYYEARDSYVVPYKNKMCALSPVVESNKDISNPQVKVNKMNDYSNTSSVNNGRNESSTYLHLNYGTQEHEENTNYRSRELSIPLSLKSHERVLEKQDFGCEKGAQKIQHPQNSEVYINEFNAKKESDKLFPFRIDDLAPLKIEISTCTNEIGLVKAA